MVIENKKITMTDARRRRSEGNPATPAYDPRQRHSRAGLLGQARDWMRNGSPAAWVPDKDIPGSSFHSEKFNRANSL